MTTPSWMPPLPDEDVPFKHAYTASQMHAYAEAYRKAWVASLKPVAWAVYWNDGSLSSVTETDPCNYLYDDGESRQSAVELYRLDDQP